MNDQDLLRYSRQIMLPQIDVEGQQKLLNATVLLVGVGGLGSASAMYLASSGIGHIIIADFDQVELSNLQRQIIHHTKDIGRPKVDSAKEKIHAINPDVEVSVINEKLTNKNIDQWIGKADVVLDGTDNFDTRFIVNKACVRQKKPLVSAAVIRFEGQLSVFKGFDDNQPCYQCLYSSQGGDDNNCTDNGILAPVAGLMGSLQALQAIKVILNMPGQLDGQLMVIDALDLSFRKITVNKDKQCLVCSEKPKKQDIQSQDYL